MDASTEHTQGIEFAENGALDAAIDSFSNVILLLPDEPEAYYNRGLAYLKNGELEKAIADFDEAIRLRPDVAAAYANRGVAYNSIGDFDQAQSDFAKAKELSRTNCESRDDQAVYLTDRARRVMKLAREEAYQKNNDYVGTEHVLLGLLNEGSGVTPSMVRRIERDFDKVRAELTTQLEKGTRVDVTTNMRPTPAVVRALEVAAAEARTLGHNGVQAEHILLGILQSPEEIAGSVLLGFGIDPKEVRAEIDKWD